LLTEFHNPRDEANILDRGSQLSNGSYFLKEILIAKSYNGDHTSLMEMGKNKNLDSKAGWFPPYWEQIDDQILGTAIVVNPSLILSSSRKKKCY